MHPGLIDYYYRGGISGSSIILYDSGDSLFWDDGDILVWE